jgi:ankyrin repeat domain-containing protein 50
LRKTSQITAYQSVQLTRHARSIVVDHLTRFRNETVETVAVACVYCNHKEREKQTVLQLIASILRQLVDHRSAASDNLINFYREFHDHRKTSPKLRDVMEALRVEIGTYSQVYIIADALDECLEGNQGELIEKLRSLPDVKLMFTSRPLVLIEQQLEGVERLVISANNADVQKYIEGRISKTPVLDTLRPTEPCEMTSLMRLSARPKACSYF